MPNIHIRQATIADEPEWFRCRCALWPEYLPADLQRELHEISASQDRSPVFVAVRSDGRLGGFLEANLRSIADGCASSPVAYIEGWYVDPDLHRQGVGRRLVEAAEAWARSIGCTEIASDCILTNSTSLSAHTALGYKEVDRLIHFQKSLI